MPEKTVAGLEEAVRLCDAAIARLQSNPSETLLLEELKSLRADQIERIARLRRAIRGADTASRSA